MTTTFIHTADWQLGKPFARITDPIKRSLVIQERLEVLNRVAAAARDAGAAFIVVAGDLFDSPSATKATVAAACSAIGQMQIPVFAIPGNHDHGGPGSLWEQEFFQRECAALAPNFRILLTPEPVVVDQAVLFPCPLLRRAESIDPTAWLRDPAVTAALPPDKPRIVLAHGSVQGFSAATGGDDDGESAADSNFLDLSRLPPDSFDYLALGDWHGTKSIAANAWYSGTPEPDRFPKGDANLPGHVLRVTATRAALPQVTILPTARLGWHQIDWHFTEDSALPALIDHLQQWLGQRANTDLLRLSLTGSLGIAAAAILAKSIESWTARLLRLKLSDQTATAPTAEELNALTQRLTDPLIAQAAQTLAAQAATNDTARRALQELHALLP